MRNSFKIVSSQAFSDADVNMRESVGHKDYCARVRGVGGPGGPHSPSYCLNKKGGIFDFLNFS